MKKVKFMSGKTIIKYKCLNSNKTYLLFYLIILYRVIIIEKCLKLCELQNKISNIRAKILVDFVGQLFGYLVSKWLPLKHFKHKKCKNEIKIRNLFLA